MAIDYEISCQEQWLVLIWKSTNDSGRQTLFSADGRFSGSIDLPNSACGGKVTVCTETLAQKRVGRKILQLPQAAGYAAPTGVSNAKVTAFTLEETPEGFHYSFQAPGTDFMLLRYSSKQQTAQFPVYPVNDEGLYQGDVASPLTYARTQFTVQVRNGKGALKKEDTVRKGYEAPAAPQGQPGRLSGLVVCIDPGHQENGRIVTEPNGPGLKGTTKGKGGMAQGTITMRRESIVVLETGMLLRDLLLHEGATVVMTRQRQDEFHTNLERAEIAAQAGAHIMLRLHCNKNSKARVSGIGLYTPKNSDYARAVAAPEEYFAMGQAFLDEMKKAVGYELTSKTGSVYQTDRYVGSNWAQMTCFLVEMGYMSNPAEDVKLATPEYQTMLAQGMVEGIYQVALMRGWITE